MDLATATSQESVRGLRLTWLVVGALAYAVGAAVAQVSGEVLGEAWGGDFLHLLGHGVGTVLHIGLVVVAAWIMFRECFPWVDRWAMACILGSAVGLVVYVPILAFATEPVELIIALSLHLPLGIAAIIQWRSLRAHLPGAGRWAASWYGAMLAGIAVLWFVGGGLKGVSIGSPFPVFEKSIDHFVRMFPRGLLGGIAFAVLSALAMPLGRTPRDRIS